MLNKGKLRKPSQKYPWYVILLKPKAGIAQLARASAFQAEGRGFESRFPLHLNLASWH